MSTAETLSETGLPTKTLHKDEKYRPEGFDDMALDDDDDHSDRLRRAREIVSERIARAEMKQEGHELLCAQRYSQIVEKLTELRADITSISKVGFILAVILFGVELGKATFPAIFSAIIGH